MKEPFIRLTVRVLRGRLSICECASFPFGFEGGMLDLIVLIPDHCLSLNFTFLKQLKVNMEPPSIEETKLYANRPRGYKTFFMLNSVEHEI